ncbi:MAG: fibronectin type III domain-containing protein [Acidobacteriota bacterium]
MVIKFRIAATYKNGTPVKGISRIQVLEYTGKEKSLSFSKFKKKAIVLKELMGVETKNFNPFEDITTEKNIKLNDINRKNYFFSVNYWDDKKRKYESKSLIFYSPSIVSTPPENFSYEIKKDEIEIRWNPPSKNIDESVPPLVSGYNIYKKIGEEKEFKKMNEAPLLEEVYRDKDFEFGEQYYYKVRSIKSFYERNIESSDSMVLKIVLVDTFPPEPPHGLQSFSGEGFIMLSWVENKEKDILGYNIYRREERGKEILLTKNPVLGNTFKDEGLKPMVKYTYRISAVDRNGNESKKSAEIQEIVR